MKRRSWMVVAGVLFLLVMTGVIIFGPNGEPKACPPSTTRDYGSGLEALVDGFATGFAKGLTGVDC